MNQQINKHQADNHSCDCSGEPLLGKQVMGGHVEDYTICSDKRRQRIPYPPKMVWVPVSQSFKKD